MILSDPHQDDCPIIFCNRAFEKLTGYGQDDIVGHNCRFLQGQGTPTPRRFDRIRTAIRKREDVHEEVFNYRKDGSGLLERPLHQPGVRHGGRTAVFSSPASWDVTRRHEAEAVLQQAQRLETLGAMASGVAHEFNNLMTVVLGSLAQLERGIAEGSRERERLDRAKWAASQAGRLTQQMLSFARRQFHDNQTLDLNRLLADFDAILRQMAGNGVDLRLELCPEPLMVELDSSQTEMGAV